MAQLAEILLVEDNPRDVTLAVEALRDAKVRTNLHVAADGVAALSFLRHDGKYADVPRPDLILLDLNLPSEGGRQVLREIKADDRLKRIPVVVLTTLRSDEDIISSYDLHVHGYITKPLDLRQFTTTVLSVGDLWFSLVTTAPVAVLEKPSSFSVRGVSHTGCPSGDGDRAVPVHPDLPLPSNGGSNDCRVAAKRDTTRRRGVGLPVHLRSG